MEFAPANEAGANKRRSARIVQAVPVTVSGTDALGQPFKERTSTLIINCHGFKYQSKHYVLKGTTVEVEIPHPEAGKDPRRVRGNVTFVQRPRTVRELFQVGVELETPGNVWGIAFPPEDWFPYTDEAVKPKEEEAEAPKAAPVAEVPIPVPPPAPPAAETPPPAPTPPKSSVPFRVPTPPQPIAPPQAPRQALPEGLVAEVPMTVAKQWARMVAEAQQQIQRAAKDAATTAVSMEAASLLRELSAQMKDAANKAVETASATYADQIISKAAQRIEDLRRTSAQELRASWEKEFTKDTREAAQQIQSRLAEVGETFRQDFAGRLRADVELAVARLVEMEQRMIALHKQVHAGAGDVQGRVSKLREEFDVIAEEARQKWSDQLISKAEENTARLAEMEASAQRIHAQVEAASRMAQEGWRSRIEEDTRKAFADLDSRVSAMLSGAENRLAGKVEEAASGAKEHIDAEMRRRLAEVQRSAEESVTAASQKVAALQTELQGQMQRGNTFAGELESVLRRASEQALRLDMTVQSAGEELNRRFEEIFAANNETINKHAEALVSDMSARLAPALDARSEELLARVSADIERRIAPQMSRAEALLQQLQSHEVRLDEAVRNEKDRLRLATDEFTRRSIADIRGAVEQLQGGFDESCKKLLGRFLEEAESKSNELSHSTFESMYKSAEWYQKKTQQAMQSALEKASAEAIVHLREKAAELSGTYAAELAHYSRSYVEHTQEQLEEAIREGIVKARSEFTHVAETTGAQFGDEVQRLAEQKIGLFRESAGSALREANTQLSARGADFARDILVQSEKMHAEFGQRLAERMRQSLADAERDFHAKFTPLVTEWRAELQAHQNELVGQLEKRGNESAEQYRQRLENVSNTCIVAAVATLNAQCQSVLESLARTGEERVRVAFSQAVAGLGESLRRSLDELSGQIHPQEKK
jgi:hypothetical protein